MIAVLDELGVYSPLKLFHSFWAVSQFVGLKANNLALLVEFEAMELDVRTRDETHHSAMAAMSLDHDGALHNHLWRVKRICVFEHPYEKNKLRMPSHSEGPGIFLSEGSAYLTACMSEQQRFWRDCVDVQACLNLRCSHRH